MSQVAPPLRSMHHGRMSASVTGKPDLPTRQNLRRLFLLRNFTILGIVLGLGLARGILNQELPVVPLGIILLLLEDDSTWLLLHASPEAPTFGALPPAWPRPALDRYPVSPSPCSRAAAGERPKSPRFLVA